MAETRNIYVYYDGEQVESPLMMGLLSCGHLRGKDIFSFEFDKSWLADKRFRSFDPDLQMFGGKQYVPQGKDNFGIFLDSTPDRWGRVLLERKEAEKLEYKRKCSIPEDQAELAKVEAFIKDYRHFIDNAKIERQAVNYTEGEALAKGFKPLSSDRSLRQAIELVM